MKQALTQLENDMTVLHGFLSEVLQTSRAILVQLGGEVVEVVENGDDEEAGRETIGSLRRELLVDSLEINRHRDAPFKRRPRTEQVAWLLGVMKDKEWH